MSISNLVTERPDLALAPVAPATLAERFEQWADAMTPDTWCQRATARDALGQVVAFDDPLATRWCAIGMARRLFTTSVIRLLFAAYVHRYGTCLEHDNDRWGLQRVRRHLYELAALRAEP